MTRVIMKSLEAAGALMVLVGGAWYASHVVTYLRTMVP